MAEGNDQTDQREARAALAPISESDALALLLSLGDLYPQFKVILARPVSDGLTQGVVWAALWSGTSAAILKRVVGGYLDGTTDSPARYDELAHEIHDAARSRQQRIEAKRQQERERIARRPATLYTVADGRSYRARAERLKGRIALELPPRDPRFFELMEFCAGRLETCPEWLKERIRRKPK